MADKPILLVVSEADGGDCSVPSQLDEQYEVVRVETPLAALSEMARRPLAGVYVDAGHLGAALQIERLLESDRILEGMPDGVVLLDSDNIIIWGNGRLREWGDQESVVGKNFYSVLGSPEIIGPDFCPFHTVLATGKPSGSTLRTASNRYYQIHAAPVCDRQGPPMHLVVTVRDVTNEMLQQQKLEAIHRAGIELADLTAQELSEMSVDERIDLLKSNILHYTQHLLSFDVVEIRLLDQESNRLSPLLCYGMTDEAATRELYASPQNNGVTGFVAATGKSYLCEDTTEDPLYLLGSHDAKSSLTVPLVLHDKVIGSFNVESPQARAFTENDLQFLEIFSRDVAVALNTLELLVAEKASTTLESVEAIHSAVALPVDEILNEAVNVMERYIGHEPQVVEQLQRILRNARDIKQVIQQVGQQMAPAQAVSQGEVDEDHERLRGRRVLVVDEDENVRSVAHNLLERYGCIVETAHDGNEAMRMVRATNIDGRYDVILADIRLPDMTGYEFLMKLKEVLDHPPLTLMTGFGYDSGHSLVKARQAGCMEVLYKPFRVDQLLETMIRIVTTDDVTPA